MKHNTTKLSKDDLYDMYGIELNDDGSVFDPVENKSFVSMSAWQYFVKQQENDNMYGGMEKTNSRYVYDEYE